MSIHSMPSEENQPNLDDDCARLLRGLQYERGKRAEGDHRLGAGERVLMAELAVLLEQPLMDYLRPKHPKWEDILRKTSLKLCQGFHLYDPLRPAMPWIYRIADNALHDQVRNDDRHAGRPRRRGKRGGKSAKDNAEGADETDRQRQAARIEWDDPRDKPEEREGREMSPDAKVELREQLDKMNRLKAEGPETRREILRLANERNLSYPQIAELLGITEAAVTSSVSRSREKLIDGMGEDLREYVNQLRKRRRKKRQEDQRQKDQRDRAAGPGSVAPPPPTE